MGSEEKTTKNKAGNGGDFQESSLTGGRKSFKEKAMENPMVPLGLGGAALAVVLSLGSYRKKDPNMKTSVYVIHTRMLAQGIVIGSMVVAMGIQLYQNHIKPTMTTTTTTKPDASNK